MTGLQICTEISKKTDTLLRMRKHLLMVKEANHLWCSLLELLYAWCSVFGHDERHSSIKGETTHYFQRRKKKNRMVRSFVWPPPSAPRQRRPNFINFWIRCRAEGRGRCLNPKVENSKGKTVFSCEHSIFYENMKKLRTGAREKLVFYYFQWNRGKVLLLPRF